MSRSDAAIVRATLDEPLALLESACTELLREL